MYSTPDHKSQEGWDPAVALPQGTRTDENVLSLVFRDPPANPVLRVRVAQKLGLHLVGNTRARDGPSWSSVLSGNKFTSIFRIFFFFGWQPSGASIVPIQKVRDILQVREQSRSQYHTKKTGPGSCRALSAQKHLGAVLVEEKM